MRSIIVISGILAACLSNAQAEIRHVELKTRQDKTHYRWGEPIRIAYDLIDGTDIFRYEKTKKFAPYVVGAYNYHHYTPPKILHSILSKKLETVGSGEFVISTRDIPFTRDFHRYVGHTNHHVFFIQRELSVPPGLLRTNKQVYEVGEPITITVSDEVRFLKDDKWLPPDSQERPEIEIWRAPRNVPGGAVELPEILWSSRDWLNPVGPVEGFSITMNQYDEQKGWPFELKSLTGYLPHGNYDVLLTVRGTVIERLKGGIEIVGPQRESVQAMRLEPALDEDEHNDDGVPVYDEFPALRVNKDLAPHFLKQGSIGIYRVGSHGELRSKQYHWWHNNAQISNGRSWLHKQDTGGSAMTPGLYEARYYFGGQNNNNNGRMLLQSMRFYVSKKALESDAPQGAPPLAKDIMRISSAKAGPYHIGEPITLTVIRDEAHEAWDDEVEEALEHSDLQIALRRLGQYYSNCTYLEEEDVAAPLMIQKGKVRPIKGPDGGLGTALQDMQNAFVSANNGAIDAPLMAPLDAVYASAQHQAVSRTNHDKAIPRIVYENGLLTLNPPDVPGRYAVDIYRRDSADMKSGSNEKFHDLERLHRFEFTLEAQSFSGLLAGKIPAQLRQSDAYVSQYKARHLLPGGLRGYMSGYPQAGEGPLMSDHRSTAPAKPSKYEIADHDFNVRRAELNGYLLEESDPFRVLPGESLEYWSAPETWQFPKPKPPKQWPKQYVTKTIAWNELVIPKDAWLMSADACLSEPLPNFTLRLVRLDGAREVQNSDEWQDRRYGLLDFDEMEYEQLDNYYLGYPFFIEAEFDAPPTSQRVRAKVRVSEQAEREVWLVRSQDDARIYRSEKAHYVGANSGLEEE